MLQTQKQLWIRGGYWLLLLAPLFFLTYIPVNQYTATRVNVGSFAFNWEHIIPFWAWTIIPYWTEDLLYGLSLFVCISKKEQTIHAFRLIAASVIACLGFLIFPLKFSFGRPEISGLFGWFFDQLSLFDLPYNQAPSLHIILLWLIWLRFRAHLTGKWLGLLHIWCIFIAVSVLTTWQHHFIDVFSGFIVGVLISYILPIQTQWHWQKIQDKKAAQLQLRYLFCAIASILLAWWLKSWLFSSLLLWIAFDFILLTLAYSGLGTSIFQKNTQGNISLSAKIVLAPFLIGAWCVVSWFNRKTQHYNEIIPGVFLGQYPNKNMPKVKAAFDLTAKWFHRPYQKNIAYYSCPRLDLIVPTVEELTQSVFLFDQVVKQHSSVLIHCALGLSRSALVVTAWLYYNGDANTIDEAINLVKTKRPVIFFRDEHINLLHQWATTQHAPQ
ncbi:phosphatase PAP2/dual specificity phosphatase family protein [Neisseria sp. Ec49-e6-T10]|uniref:phosphatase PAP2/dual specificity phosphatase family protein n=1 Tax=Neisseria sp. Ec49-e6-T10 TaxID=3140744 RepID=UPI003EC0FACD